jgi:predicted AAA+ superfamily ATPase
LLNEVHRLIENCQIKFLLTGSSARKLRHGGANLLAGRAWVSNLFPLISKEIPDFDLMTYLHTGGLPQVYGKKNWEYELQAYIDMYLIEEIKSEALVRNLDYFTSFMDVMGLNNGQELAYENIASDCGVNVRTVQNYVAILEDTLLGFKLPPFRRTNKRKAITRSKFYLFDVGVAGVLGKKGSFNKDSKAFGDAFEHFIINEIRAYLSYSRKRLSLEYWRSVSKLEVDCIVEDKCAIKIKSSKAANDRDLKGLRAFKEEQLIQRFMVVSQDDSKRKTTDGIEIYPWQLFLDELWNNEIV